MTKLTRSVIVAYKPNREYLWVGALWGGCTGRPQNRKYVPLATLWVPKSDLAAYLGEELARKLLDSPLEKLRTHDGDELCHQIALPDQGLSFPTLSLSFNCGEGLRQKYDEFLVVAKKNIFAPDRKFTYEDRMVISESLHIALQLFAGLRKANAAQVNAEQGEANKVLRGFNDLATTHPEIAKEADGWDPTTVRSDEGDDNIPDWYSVQS